MNKFKAGDKVRRVSMELSCVPIGYETVVSPPPEGRTDVEGLIWYEWPREPGNYVQSSDILWESVLPEQVLPIRTVTRHEIIPGTYGRVEVSPHAGTSVTHVGVRLEPMSDCYAALNASELRAAARILISLAEALEQEK